MLLGALVGTAYAVAARVVLEEHLPAAMTLTFLCLVPVGLGFVSAWLAERSTPLGPLRWAAATLLPTLGASLATVLVSLEGWICVVFFLPLGFLMAALGGLAGGATARHLRRRGGGALACVLLLPALAMPVERRIGAPTEVRTVETSIDVDAPAEVVWGQIARVRAISPAELPPSWTYRIGFPRPIEATLSRDGNGGVRRATFEGGVLFLETVDLWEPGRRLGFSIHAEDVPKSALDPHATIGGQFFDVQRGDYALEPLSQGRTRLRLSSRHRLSTHFNAYAHLWTCAVMADIQGEILQVVRRRSEAAAAAR